MKKNLLFIICLLLSWEIGFSQLKPKPSAKQTAPVLKKILSGTTLPYKIINDSLAVIPYEGENIASYNVVIQIVSDLYIVYVNLGEVLPGKLNDTQYKYLLQQNDHFDIIKIGLSEDGTYFLRADLYKTTATSPILKRIISQVANVANIIGGDLK